ncbi:hypothetical protein IFM89_030268 [Coptis chinensis]|uniref:RNase H type-1 domain-containing protein n=1 Tax=Coptis chinensis TaxID=261450 RepID=A0A835LTH4_9MAGN|nr:hypothetical protein IFM89_030268 [Coptis chinensis]
MGSALMHLNTTSSLLKHMWNASIVTGKVIMWKHRNKVCFKEEIVSLRNCQRFVHTQVPHASQTSKGYIWGNNYDKEVIKNWGGSGHLGRALKIHECEWLAPAVGIIKINPDGAARGNPGIARLGAIFRDNNGVILMVLSKGLAVTTSYMAECS